MFSAWKQLSSRGYSLEAGHLREAEVQRQVFILVCDGEGEVFALVGGTLAKLELLLADFDIWIAGPCHHLHLEIVVLKVAE